MIDRLRAFLNRPLADNDRRSLFLVAVAVIVAAAGALALIERPTPPSRDRAQTRPANSPSAVPATSEPAPQVVLPPPSEEGKPTQQPAASRVEVRRAKHAARSFLAGYLPYTYAQRDAVEIAAATTRLRRQLAAQPPRVPARERARRPRLVLLQTDAVGRLRATATALVNDGARRYTVSLQLARQRGAWRVSDVGG